MVKPVMLAYRILIASLFFVTISHPGNETSHPAEFSSDSVDLIALSTPAHSISWGFRTEDRTSTLFVDGESHRLSDSEIPIYSADIPNERIFLISRQLQSNENLAGILSIAAKIKYPVPLPDEMRHQAQMWAMKSDGSNVFVVYYKPRARSTYLIRCAVGTGDDVVFSDPVLLDDGTLSPPISVMPKILFHDTKVYIVSGLKTSVLPVDLGSPVNSLFLPTNTFLCDGLVSSNRVLGLALQGIGFADKGGCTNGCVPKYMLWDVMNNTQLNSEITLEGPVRLRSEAGQAYLQFARPTPESVSEWVKEEALSGVGSGVRYLGVGNSETHLGWAGAEMLFNWIDIVTEFQALPSSHYWRALLKETRRRLDLEIRLLDYMLNDPKAALESTRQSVAGRDPIILTVMPARVLRALQRYRDEISDPIEVQNFSKFEKMVEDLEGHLEELVPAGVGLLPNAAYLRWKYGVPFEYDGVNLPFNMQNTWAETMLLSERGELRQAGEQMILYFLDREEMLERDIASHPHWRYWWGDAYNGWTAAQNISSNRPSFSGYKNAGSIGYRSIDAAAVLRLDKMLNRTVVTPGLLRFFTKQVEVGTLYPPVGGLLPQLPNIPRQLLTAYSRGGSSEDFRQMIWTFALTLSKEGAPAWPRDTDGDGLIDVEEAALDTNPETPDIVVQFESARKIENSLEISWRGVKDAVFEIQHAEADNTPLKWRSVLSQVGTGLPETATVSVGAPGGFFRIKMLGIRVE